MKTHIKTYYLLTLLILISAFVNAQTVDEIIAKHIKAHGGQENWDKVESLAIEGAFTGFSTQKTFKALYKTPNYYRWDGGVGKFNVTLVFDGMQGWTIDPWFEIDFPRVLNSSEQNVVEQKAEICSPFLNYKQKKYQVELLNKEDVDGIDMFLLKLTRPSGKTEKWYLNAETFLEYKYTSHWDDFGYTLSQETYFDDYRAVGGLIIPFYIDRSFGIRNRVTEIKSVEVNPKVNPKDFYFPISLEMQKLAFMIGDWAVEVMAPSRRGWYRSDSTSATIEQNANILQTHIVYENYVRYNKQYTWSFNTESKSYRVTEYNGFSSNMIISESKGFNNDTIIFNNEKISFHNNDDKVIRKYKLIKLNENKFVVERSRFLKNGETWQTNEKLVFTRIE